MGLSEQLLSQFPCNSSSRHNCIFHVEPDDSSQVFMLLDLNPVMSIIANVPAAIASTVAVHFYLCLKRR